MDISVKLKKQYINNLTIKTMGSAYFYLMLFNQLSLIWMRPSKEQTTSYSNLNGHKFVYANSYLQWLI